MKYTFTSDDIKNEINKVYLEDEDVLLEGDYIEDFEEEPVEGHNHGKIADENERLFKLVSKAEIDGERYHDFETLFAVSKDEKCENAADIMSCEWLWYDWIL